ncbi:MAG: MarR family winged helix-turn-helix transcriptional regulator [Saprospiraceae bacterium]
MDKILIANSKNFGFPIDRAIKMIRSKYNSAFRQLGFDITTEQWVLIEKLYHQNGQSQSNLAEGSYKNAPTVSRIIDLLVKKGFVERQRFENDRRRYKIFLTESGSEVVETCYPKILELRESGWQGLTDEDYENFMKIINQITENHF